MQTVVTIIALAGSIVSANIPEKPQWRSNYREACLLASESKKPIAVFIGNGATGFEKVSKDGFDNKVFQLLREKYVCVSIDTSTPTGKSLAQQFAVKETGLVISDQSGKIQAFHHVGDLKKEQLVKALERYADPKHEVLSTESIAQVDPAAQPAIKYQSTCPNCPNYIGSGSCPNGNCPR